VLTDSTNAQEQMHARMPENKMSLAPF